MPRPTARHVLYLTGTVGIGAGIVEDGDLVRGAAGLRRRGRPHAGRRPGRRVCGCGRQRLLGGLDRPARHARRGRHDRAGHPAATPRGPSPPAALTDAERARGPRPARPRRRPRPRGARPRFSTRPSSSSAATSSRSATWSSAPARRTLDERLVSDVQRRPELRPGALGIQAAALGAAEWSFGDLFAGELDLSALTGFAGRPVEPDVSRWKSSAERPDSPLAGETRRRASAGEAGADVDEGACRGRRPGRRRAARRRSRRRRAAPSRRRGRGA